MSWLGNSTMSEEKMDGQRERMDRPLDTLLRRAADQDELRNLVKRK